MNRTFSAVFSIGLVLANRALASSPAPDFEPALEALRVATAQLRKASEQLSKLAKPCSTELVEAAPAIGQASPLDALVASFGPKFRQILTQEIEGSLRRQKLTEPPSPDRLLFADNMVRLSQTSRSDTLTILMTGLTHSIDYYFKIPDESLPDVSFVSFPVREDTHFRPDFKRLHHFLTTELETAERADLRELLNGFARLTNIQMPLTEVAELCGGIFSTNVTANLPVVGATVFQQRTRLGQGIPGRNGFPHTLSILDLHGIDEDSHIDELPSAEALLANGVRRVVLGIEGYAPNQYPTHIAPKLIVEAAEGVFWMALIPADLHSRWKFPEQRFGGNRPLRRLLQRAEEYRAQGLSVVYEGLGET